MSACGKILSGGAAAALRGGCAALAGFLAALGVWAATPAPAPRAMFQADARSSIRILGSATLGQWECETRDITAVVEPGPALEALASRVSVGRAATTCAATPPPAVPLSPDALPYANITIPVTSLRCSKPGMRRDLLRALRHEEAPLIVFILGSLTDLQMQERRPGELGRYHVTARGDLVLAGTLRPIDVSATVVQETPRRFRIEARKVLRMSEFAVEPPAALFGAIRADDRVALVFDLIFEDTRNR